MTFRSGASTARVLEKLIIVVALVVSRELSSLSDASKLYAVTLPEPNSPDGGSVWGFGLIRSWGISTPRESCCAHAGSSGKTT